MTISTAAVAAHTAPAGVVTYLKHFLYHRSTRKDKPTSQISYDEGLAIIRQFLAYASTHTLAEIQHFTANKVPTPRWVSKVTVTVPEESIHEATGYLRNQLSRDPEGLDKVGGATWWTMRGRSLTGEWIEMKKDKLKRGVREPERVMLYIHGGAYFFSSLETHRYQIQRHARKLGARAFAPSYRLAPQYPFPCGLLDVLASYLYLINPPPGSSHAPVPPQNIILSGDSAGGGAVLSLLIILRDQGLPMPAGATLISPWVDLAHSFPSVMHDDSGDYIPSDGFHYRPGLAWPPIKGDGITVTWKSGDEAVHIEEQLQMYCPNTLLNHPLVSPANQGSLGGLPPLYIMGGSSELLIDEIQYIAHKAAAPPKYPPSTATQAAYPVSTSLGEHPPTSVHLSVFDGCAHVTPTLSITRPAKFMYRGAANFGLWALTTAKKKVERRERRQLRQDSRDSDSAPTSSANSSIRFGAVHPQDHEAANEEEHTFDSGEESELSSDSEGELEHADESEFVTVTGHEPTFVDHMVRERVTSKGVKRAMEPAEEMEACTMDPEQIGVVHVGPITKWLARREKWDKKYSKDLAKWRKVKEDDRAKAEASGYLKGMFVGERPPLTALAGYHDEKLALDAANSVDETGKTVNAALAMWASLSAKPDEEVVNKASDAKDDDDNVEPNLESKNGVERS